MIMRAIPLSMLLCSLTFNQAQASSVPWCAPESALLTFKGPISQKVAKVELRPVETICTMHGAEKASGMSLPRSMRIEYDGKWSEVPRTCLSGVSFRLDQLSVSVEEIGMGIQVIGTATGGAEKIETLIYYPIGNKVSCARVEPCGTDPNELCSRHLAPLQ